VRSVPHRAWILLFALAAAFSPPARAQGSDSCATPTPIAGTGIFPWSGMAATTAPPPANLSAMYCGDIWHNVWFRWQAPAAGGWVTISTCNQVPGETAISVYRYQGAGCPAIVGTTQIYCSLNVCPPNGLVTFSYVPNLFYVIEVGSKPNCPPAAGTFSIDVTLSSPMTSLCHPGEAGTVPCPCGNPPTASGRGCDNFGAGPPESGLIDATGTPSLSADTIVLEASGLNFTSFSVFFQGRDPVNLGGVPHSAGVRCVNQTLRRLYTGSASGGAISRPGLGDPSVHDRSVTVGDPIFPGENRNYFVIYRDPAAAGPCGNTASTVNLTNTGSLTWAP
jgi:hypothetical protein